MNGFFRGSARAVVVTVALTGCAAEAADSSNDDEGEEVTSVEQGWTRGVRVQTGIEVPYSSPRRLGFFEQSIRSAVQNDQGFVTLMPDAHNIQNLLGDDYPEGHTAFILHDTRKDGKRVAVHWRLKDGSKQGVCINPHGISCNSSYSLAECKNWGALCVLGKTEGNGGAAFIPEGKGIQFRVGSCDADKSSCTLFAAWSWGVWQGYNDDSDRDYRDECNEIGRSASHCP